LHWTGPAERSSRFESWSAPGRPVNVRPLSAFVERVNDGPSQPRPDQILDYGQRRHPSALRVVRLTIAILFAVGALLLGVLLALSGLWMLADAKTREYASDRRTISRDGRQTLLCSAILIAPGMWYAFAAMRELRSGDDRPGR